MLTCCRLALPNDLMTHGGAFAERELLLLQLFAFVTGFFFFFFYCFLCHSPPRNHGYTFFMVIPWPIDLEKASQIPEENRF